MLSRSASSPALFESTSLIRRGSTAGMLSALSIQPTAAASLNAEDAKTDTEETISKVETQPTYTTSIRTSNIPSYLKYRISYDKILFERGIESGSCGSVQLGKWNGQQMAIKLAVDTPSMIEIVRAEANIYSKLHEVGIRHIPKYYGYFEEPKKAHYGFAMEFIPNPDLCTLLVAGSLTVSQAYLFTQQTILFLADMHQHHFIDRDLKLENLIPSKNFQEIVKCDFGFTVQVDESNTYIDSSNERLRGTPECLAPEILASTCKAFITYSDKTDLYALAIVIWDLFSKGRETYGHLREKYETQHAWDSRKRLALYSEVLAGRRPPFYESHPPGIRQLISSLWHPNPNERPTAVKALEEINRLIEERERNSVSCSGSAAQRVLT